MTGEQVVALAARMRSQYREALAALCHANLEDLEGRCSEWVPECFGEAVDQERSRAR